MVFFNKKIDSKNFTKREIMERMILQQGVLMKLFFCIPCLLACTLFATQETIEPQQSNISQEQASMQPDQTLQGITWMTDFHAAKKLAQEQNKPLLLYFTGSDWCTWCMRLDKEILTTAAFEQLAGPHFIFVNVDFPKYKQLDPQLVEQNRKLRDEYKIVGFPTIVLLDPNMHQIGTFYYKNESPEAYAQRLIDAAQAIHSPASSLQPMHSQQ